MSDLWKGPGFTEVNAGSDDMNIASIAWGISLGVGIFTFTKALRQTMDSWSRGRKMNHYIVLVWLEWTSSCLMSAVTWCYLRNYIPGGFPVFFVLIMLWCIQIQALIQIIINRIAILMVNRQNAKWLKIWSFLIILCINISVIMIWIPARLQINDTWMNINKVWDRIEKVIFLLVDAGLNLYFIHLVRSRLIANGLTKYTRLFHYNLGMIVVSMTMDILLIAMMSLPNDVVYVQFHPLAYLVKLHIEMNMADLIVKVVKASNGNGYDYSGSKSGSTQPKQKSGNKLGKGHIPSAMFIGGNLTLIQAGVDDIEMNRMEGGIQKTTRTEVEVVVKQNRSSDSDDQDSASNAESMRPLRNGNTYTIPEPKRRRSSQIAILTAP
ncbi:hypothetical protein FLAG1_01018 [Fusarium langsethiae]|uniref:Integral membrane protein n=1 Tax=Fusarium langsethiae TaxID=179993 RepID=A0A0N0V8G6_FUSLA|nr:hypothetical protein FLAG1_01018 [Fusarium langsethiae]GKT99546.1 unnamed protein product [Fusarium langsethiae]GKU19672.1 unnamed protein product [Fusarium langsethiae]